ncbi:MAG: cell division protein FtsA, partial [Candidatus Zixiibacteriota bacterium]
VGMSGVRLEVEAHIVTASVTTARNIMRALERCRLDVDHMVLESVALAEVVLAPVELEMGVIMIDIGGEITNVAAFFDGAIRHTSVIPLGSQHVTNDIAIAFRTPVDQAEILKVKDGAALTGLADPSESFVLAGGSGRPMKELPRGALVSIIEARMEEILSLAVRELRQTGIGDALTAGVVLTGGGALIPGCAELAEQLFDLPARVADINGIDHTPEELNNARFATAHGLLTYGFHHEPTAGGRS